MKLHGILQTGTSMTSAALIAAAMVLGAAGGASAQDSISVPSGLCNWNWSSSSTDALLSKLAARDDFNQNMRYVTNECPQALCDADWSGEGAQAALAKLGGRDFFGDLVGSLSQSCPDVALLMTEGATATVGVPDVGQPSATRSPDPIPDDGDDEEEEEEEEEEDDPRIPG